MSTSENYTLNISVQDGIVRAIVSGAEGYWNMVSYWKKIAAECERSGCQNIILNRDLEGPCNVFDLFEFGRHFNTLGLHPDSRIAIVCEEEKFDNIKFIRDVIANRFSFRLQAFTSEERARAWLSGNNLPVDT